MVARLVITHSNLNENQVLTRFVSLHKCPLGHHVLRRPFTLFMGSDHIWIGHPVVHGLVHLCCTAVSIDSLGSSTFQLHCFHTWDSHSGRTMLFSSLSHCCSCDRMAVLLVSGPFPKPERTENSHLMSSRLNTFKDLPGALLILTLVFYPASA